MKLIERNNMFDIVLMNPPYSKNMHLKFMEKTFNILSENGSLVYIGPDGWIINKFGYGEKSKLRTNTKEKYSKYIDDIETFSPEKFNKYFGTSWGKGASIFVMKHNAKGIDISQYESDDKLLKKIITKIQKDFTSLRSHFTRQPNEKYFVPVRRTNHGYLNWVEKDKSKNKAKDGILFTTENEMNNFISSFDTWLYKFLNCTEWKASENSADVPYLNNYEERWTDEKLYKLFDITNEEKQFIETTIKDKNPWKNN